jgi:transcriptional regulator with XRE-family HTH domain
MHRAYTTVVASNDKDERGAGGVPFDRTSDNLARNLRRLREIRGLTQQGLSRASSVPRPTIAHLESGSANPTLAVLLKVAAALQITMEELIAAPRAGARHYKSGSLPTQTRGKVIVRDLLPDPIPSLSIERLELPARSSMTGVPHTPGTREYLTCERGSIELAAGGERWTLAPGDVVVFRGDQKHSYINPETTLAVAYSVVALAPSIQ